MLHFDYFNFLLLWNAFEGVTFPSHFWDPEILRRERYHMEDLDSLCGARRWLATVIWSYGLPDADWSKPNFKWTPIAGNANYCEKKCSPRRLPSLNEPENFVKSLIRVYLFNFWSLGCSCRKGLVTCHARRCNKIKLQAKSCKWLKSKISSASPLFYDWKLLYSCC